MSNELEKFHVKVIDKSKYRIQSVVPSSWPPSFDEHVSGSESWLASE